MVTVRSVHICPPGLWPLSCGRVPAPSLLPGTLPLPRPGPPPARIVCRETAIQKCYWTSDGWIRLEGETSDPQETVEAPDLPPHRLLQVLRGRVRGRRGMSRAAGCAAAVGGGVRHNAVGCGARTRDPWGGGGSRPVHPSGSLCSLILNPPQMVPRGYRSWQDAP